MCIAQYFSVNQQAQNDEGEKEENHEDVAYNMINLCDNEEEYDIEDSKNGVVKKINVY